MLTNMKLINELHQKYLNKPIWVVGSDPSLEDYPDNFLDNKLSITLHLAYLKFPNATYRYFNEIIGEAGEKAYYLNLKPYPPKGNYGSIFNDSGPNAMRAMVSEAVKGERTEYGGHGTCLHPCMYVAIMMGCNPINIIGCNFKNIEGKEHFGNVHQIDHDMRPVTPSFTGHRGTRMIKGLQAIIAGCKDNNIKVNWIKNYGG